MLEIVRELENVSPRIGKREKNAVKVIEKFLDGFEIKEQGFRNTIPRGRSKLFVDSRRIESLPSSFTSGKIEEKTLLSSINTPEFHRDSPNINFNPFSPVISLPTFFQTPSLSISRNDAKLVACGADVKGVVKIKKETFTSRNLLMGNTRNPKYIIFTHYDTILNGAIDNSSGVSVIISLIKKYPGVLKTSLFILSGSEELSCDEVYWGRGYRIFEEEYGEILNFARRIFVIDCVGFAEPVLTKEYLMDALPLNNLEKLRKKTSLITGNLKKINLLWSVYHSELDIPELLKEEYLEMTRKVLFNLLRK